MLGFEGGEFFIHATLAEGILFGECGDDIHEALRIIEEFMDGFEDDAFDLGGGDGFGGAISAAFGCGASIAEIIFSIFLWGGEADHGRSAAGTGGDAAEEVGGGLPARMGFIICEIAMIRIRIHDRLHFIP